MSSTEITPAQWLGKAVACAASVLRSSSSRAYSRAWGTTPSSSPSAQVNQPLTAYHAPPTKTALFVDRLVNSSNSVTSGSFFDGDCDEPIRAGPLASGG